MAATLLVAVFVSVLTILLVWLRKTHRLRQMINKIPGPPTMPVIGNAMQLRSGGTEFYDQVLQFSKDYGTGIFRMWMAMVPVVVLYRAEQVEAVISGTKHIDKSKTFYRFLFPWLGTGLLTSGGAKWKQRRQLLTPSFHFKILGDFLSVFNEKANILVKKLESKCANGTFNIFNDITLCALDIICETAMGRNLNAQTNSESAYIQSVYTVTELLISRMKRPWEWPKLLFDTIGDGKEHDRCLAALHAFTKSVISEKKEEFEKHNSSEDSFNPVASESLSGKKRLAFLDLLMRTTQEDGTPLSSDDIREEVDTFMFEGHDTTAAAMNWATYLIGYDPKVQQKLQEEMEKIFGDSDRDATMDDIKEMKYLECVIKEQLRLYPSVPVFARTLSEDTLIGGYLVPKNTDVVILTSAVHQDERYFPNPTVFDPDRFSQEYSAERHPFAYIPFSAGMRNCIGQRFALIEEKVVLSSIIRNFRIKSKQAVEDLMPVGDLILRPKEGIFVELTPKSI